MSSTTKTREITATTTSTVLSRLVKESVDNESLQLEIASHPNTQGPALARLTKIAASEAVCLAIIAHANVPWDTLRFMHQRVSGVRTFEVQQAARKIIARPYKLNWATGEVTYLD